MLVISRKVEETVVIPGVGTIKVVSAKNGKTKLGFECDGNIRIFRGEVVERAVVTPPFQEATQQPVPA